MEEVLTARDSTLDHGRCGIVDSELSLILTVHAFMNPRDAILTSDSLDGLSLTFCRLFALMVCFYSHLFDACCMEVLLAFTDAFDCGLGLVTHSAYFRVNIRLKFVQLLSFLE